MLLLKQMNILLMKIAFEDAEFDLVADIGNFNMEAKDELDGDVNNSDDIE